MAGNEDDEYYNDYKNIALMSVQEVYQLDPDIWDYIDSPVGTQLIRISSNKFEIDKNDKEIYKIVKLGLTIEPFFIIRATDNEYTDSYSLGKYA